MRRLSFLIPVFVAVIIFTCYAIAQIDVDFYESSVAEIYKGNIEDAADYIAEFPGDANDNILHEINSISEEIRGVLYGEIPYDLDRIEQISEYVIGVFRKTEILQWCLLNIHDHQQINLLPGEGITLTLKSYCLDKNLASPSPGELYYIDGIPGEQAEWLIPLMEIVSKKPREDFPAQGLIWNMQESVAYNDLPSDQQELLISAIPNAEELYGKDIIDEGVEEVLDFFGNKVKDEVEEVSDAIEVIDDISEIEAEIENKVSQLKLILPEYDTYQLSNGLLVRAKSTGSYKSIILTIVNPRSNELGYKSFPINEFQIVSATNNYIELIPNIEHSFLLKGWTDKLKGAKNFGEKCLDAKEKLEEIDDFIEDPDGYVKGRGFDEGLDFFKAGVKGNKKANEAFELFRWFNHYLLKAKEDKSNRPKKPGSKSMKPSDFRFKPGRDDVQPLEPVFGCG